MKDGKKEERLVNDHDPVFAIINDIKSKYNTEIVDIKITGVEYAN